MSLVAVRSVSNFILKTASLSITGKVTNNKGVAIDCEIYLMRRGIVVTRAKHFKGWRWKVRLY